MKFRLKSDAPDFDGKVIEFGQWLGDRIYFGNPTKNKPGFQPRWVSEGFAMPRDSVGSLKATSAKSLLVITADKPWVLPRYGRVGRMSNGDLIVALDDAYQEMIKAGRLTPIYDLEFYTDRVAFWDRCDQRVSYPVPEE